MEQRLGRGSGGSWGDGAPQRALWTVGDVKPQGQLGDFFRRKIGELPGWGMRDLVSRIVGSSALVQVLASLWSSDPRLGDG